MKSLKEILLRASSGLAFGVFVIGAQADPITLNLFYTTFGGGTNVHKANVTLNGSTLTINTNSPLTSTAGADGILFLPDGNLVVAGQNAQNPPQLHEITTGGAAVTSVNAGTGSYHMALSSNALNATLYNLWNGPGQGPSSISATTLAAGGLATNGTAYTVICAIAGACNTDVRGLVFDPTNNTWYYGTAVDGSTTGTFGTVSFSGTTATLTQILGGANVPAHGVTFDPFTNDIIFSSGDEIAQFDPTAASIVSLVTLPLPFQAFDQSAVDGKGHLFVASNNGVLYGLDYDSATGHLIGGAGATVGDHILAEFLDDVAPLSGAGAKSAPEPGSLALLALGLASLGFSRRKQ